MCIIKIISKLRMCNSRRFVINWLNYADSTNAMCNSRLTKNETCADEMWNVVINGRLVYDAVIIVIGKW